MLLPTKFRRYPVKLEAAALFQEQKLPRYNLEVMAALATHCSGYLELGRHTKTSILRVGSSSFYMARRGTPYSRPDYRTTVLQYHRTIVPYLLQEVVQLTGLLYSSVSANQNDN